MGIFWKAIIYPAISKKSVFGRKLFWSLIQSEFSGERESIGYIHINYSSRKEKLLDFEATLSSTSQLYYRCRYLQSQKLTTFFKVSTIILFYDRTNTTVAYKHPCLHNKMLKVICNNDNLHLLGCDVSDAWLTTLTQERQLNGPSACFSLTQWQQEGPTLHDNLSELPQFYLVIGSAENPYCFVFIYGILSGIHHILRNTVVGSFTKQWGKTASAKKLQNPCDLQRDLQKTVR